VVSPANSRPIQKQLVMSSNKQKQKKTITTVIQPDNGAKQKQKNSNPNKNNKNVNSKQSVRKTVVVEQALPTRRQRVNQKMLLDASPDGHNPYLASLLDPERFTGVRYPDKYAKKTGTLSTLINVDHPYFVDDTLEPKGFMLSVITPTLVRPVLLFKKEQVVADINFIGAVTAQTDTLGLFPSSGVESLTNGYGRAMSLQTDQRAAVAMLGGWSDQTFSSPGFKFEKGAGQIYYGFPTLTGAVNRVYLVLTRNLISGETVTLFALTKVGEITAGTITGPTTTVQHTISFSTVALGNAAGYVPLPGLALALIYETSGVDTFLGVSSFEFRFINPTSRPAGRFVQEDWPDVDTYVRTIDRYRTVSLSCWEEYQGSDLKNGGQLASISYGGGDDPFANGLYNYTQCAETPGSYQGPLKHGTYSVWLPAGDFDMLFRHIDDLRRWELPYIVNTGIIAEPDQVNALRLRVAANHELVSTSQIYTYDYSPVSLQEIELAARALRAFPLTMENPLHVGMIRDVLNRATGLAQHASKVVKQGGNGVLDFIEKFSNFF
jgi:hypothetical protein